MQKCYKTLKCTHKLQYFQIRNEIICYTRGDHDRKRFKRREILGYLSSVFNFQKDIVKQMSSFQGDSWNLVGCLFMCLFLKKDWIDFNIVIDMIIFFNIPMLLIFTIYLLIVSHIRKSTRIVQSSNVRAEQSKQRAPKMLSNLLFFIFYFFN